jgi:integrase
VVVRAGKASRRYKAVKSDRPHDLVFQSVKTGAPIRDNIVLSRHIEPAGRKLGIGWVNWRVLRRSCATLMDQAQVNVRDAQGLMRHSRASTTEDVYQQVVPEAQRKAARKLTAFVRGSVKEAVVVQ